MSKLEAREEKRLKAVANKLERKSFIQMIASNENENEERTMNKSKAWNYALGMVKIDGYVPSKEFLELVEKEIKGEITSADIKKALDKKYQSKGQSKNE